MYRRDNPAPTKVPSGGGNQEEHDLNAGADYAEKLSEWKAQREDYKQEQIIDVFKERAFLYYVLQEAKKDSGALPKVHRTDSLADPAENQKLNALSQEDAVKAEKKHREKKVKGDGKKRIDMDELRDMTKEQTSAITDTLKQTSQQMSVLVSKPPQNDRLADALLQLVIASTPPQPQPPTVSEHQVSLLAVLELENMAALSCHRRPLASLERLGYLFGLRH